MGGTLTASGTSQSGCATHKFAIRFTLPKLGEFYQAATTPQNQFTLAKLFIANWGVAATPNTITCYQQAEKRKRESANC